MILFSTIQAATPLHSPSHCEEISYEDINNFVSVYRRKSDEDPVVDEDR